MPPRAAMYGKQLRKFGENLLGPLFFQKSGPIHSIRLKVVLLGTHRGKIQSAQVIIHAEKSGVSIVMIFVSKKYVFQVFIR